MPQEPMHTPHPTSPQPTALRRRSAPQSPARAWRRGRLALAGALVLLVLLVAAGPAAAFSTEYAFTVTGHGWGHGVGMSQWGAYGYAKHGWDYKQILKHYYTGISFSDVADSVVRVNLRSGQSAVKLTCAKDFTVQGTGEAWTIPAGTTATTTHTAAATASSRAPCARPSPAPRPSRPRRVRSASSPRRTSATTAPTAARSGSCTAAGS